MPRVVPSQVVDFIDQQFDWAKDQQGKPQTIHRGNESQCKAILKLVEEIPQELIRLDSEYYNCFVLSIEAIRSMIARWQTKNSKHTEVLLFNKNAITLLHGCLALCPDEAIEPSTTELNFISDGDLRENLRKDISATNQALQNGEWKAATVLGGATIEALLLWALQQRTQREIMTIKNNLVSSRILTSNPGNKLEKWSLHPLIEVAKELNVIKGTTTDHAIFAKDFRNLIHPGKSFRIGQICNRGTTLSTIAALEFVIEDLTKKFYVP